MKGLVNNILMLLLVGIAHGQQPSGCAFPDSIRGEWVLVGDTTQHRIYGDYGEEKSVDPLESSIAFVRFEQRGDTAFMIDEEGRRTGVRLNGDYMEVHPEKKITGVLSFGACYVRRSAGAQPVQTDVRHVKIIVPKGFSGRIAIALGQPHGVPVERDELGNTLFRIPSSGLLESQAVADGFAIAGGRYRFYMELDGLLVELPQSSRFDRGRARFYAEPLVGIMCGFNAGIGIDTASAMFGKEVSGEVLMMSVLSPDDARSRRSGVWGWAGPEYGESHIPNRK